MSTTFFDSMAGPFKDWVPTTNIFGKTIKYGTINKVSYEFTGLYTTTGERIGATFTNVLTNYGFLNVRSLRDVQSFSGLNAAYISDGYGLNYEKVYDAMKRSGRYSPAPLAEAASYVTDHCFESNVGVIINMLRFYMALSGDSTGLKSVTNCDEVFYDDGHVAMSYKDYSGRVSDSTQSIRVSDAVMVHKMGVTQAPVDLYVPKLETLTEREFGIFLTMISAIDCDNGIKLMSSSPKLADGLGVPFWSAVRISQTVTDFSAKELFNLMSKFVNENRLYEDFDKAYMVVSMMTYTPLPRAIEAVGWVKAVNPCDIPRVYSYRGYVPGVTTGLSFITHADAVGTWSYFVNNQERFWLHAIIATEMLFTGIFEIATASPGGIGQAMMDLSMPTFSLTQPIRMLVEAASYRLGSSRKVIWNTDAGPDYLTNLLNTDHRANPITLTKVHDDEGYDVYELVIDGETVQRVRTTDLKPALFPVLSMGINDDRYYLNSLTTVAKLSYDSLNNCYYTTDTNQVNRAMCILRVAGYDAEAVSATGQKRVKNWAANSNGQVMPVFMLDGKGNGYYSIPAISVVKRGKCWIEMPDKFAHVELKMRAEPMNYVVFANGNRIYQSSRRLIHSKPAVKSMDDVPLTEFDITTKPEKLDYKYKSFLFLPPTDEETIRLPYASTATEAAQFSEEYDDQAGPPVELTGQEIIEEV